MTISEFGRIIILCLATWRLTSLLNIESGPFGLLSKFRLLIGIRVDEYSNVYGKNQIAEMVACHWCLSIWIGIAVAVSYYLWNDVWWLMLPLALSAVSIIIDRIATV